MVEFRARKWTALMIGLVGASVFGYDSPLVARAAQNQSTFIANYEHTAQTEAVLLEKAKSLGVTNSLAASLSSTVNSLNQQISNLFTTEQALANTMSSTPTIGSNSLNKTALMTEQPQLKAQIRSLEAQIKLDRKNKNSVQLQTDRQQLASVQTQLQHVSAELNQMVHLLNHKHAQALTTGLQNLQTSIIKLQAAEIYNTKLWILAETSSTVGEPTGSN